MSDVEMQSQNDPAPAPNAAVTNLDAKGDEHVDEEEDTGGVDEDVVAAAAAPEVAKSGGGEQKEGSDSKEEAGEVIEESERTSPAEDAMEEDGANDELHVEGEGGEGEVDGEDEVEEEEQKRRPGRPKKKSTNGDVEVEPTKAVKRPRPRADKKEIAAAFVADRPTRERKSIERFTATTEKDKSKELQIKQGEGTPLKDIPNIVYKLSKRSKHDETLSQLHSILFSKRAKAVVLKQNILQFSGYVWVENEAKEKVKAQEKLERYTKESLLQFLELLDVHVSRILKKEDLVAKLMEFLEKPHKTTEKLLEQKEQEKKNSGKRSSASKGPGRPKIRKSEEKTPSTKKARKSAAEDDGSDRSEKASDSESPVEEEIEQKRLTFKDETDHEGDSMVEEKKQASNSSTAIKQDNEENEGEEEDHEEKEESRPPRKKPKTEAPDASAKPSSKSADRFYSKKKSSEEKETSATPKKGPGRPKKSLENSAKKTPKDKETGKKSLVRGSKSKKKGIPNDGELQEKIRGLLREADFSKVTFTDVVSQLEAIFGVSLTEQKGHVKGLIRDEISKLTEVDDELEEEVAVAATPVAAAAAAAGEVATKEPESKPEDVVTS